MTQASQQPEHYQVEGASQDSGAPHSPLLSKMPPQCCSPPPVMKCPWNENSCAIELESNGGRLGFLQWSIVHNEKMRVANWPRYPQAWPARSRRWCARCQWAGSCLLTKSWSPSISRCWSDQKMQPGKEIVQIKAPEILKRGKTDLHVVSC